MTAPGAQPGRQDLVRGPILRTLVLFTAPSLLATVLQTLAGSVNAMFVGRMLGEGALAATANANIVMFLLFSAVFGFGMAATVKVGRAVGAADRDAARRSMGSALGLCGMISLVVAPAGWIWAPELLQAMQTPGESAVLALAYLRVVFIAMPAAMVITMLGMGLRGAGDAQTPLYFMIVLVGLDVVLNPLLIAGIGPFPRLGIAGSGWASAISHYIAMTGMIAWIYRRDLVLRLRGSELAYLIPRRAELGFIIAKGLPMGAQMLVISASGIIMMGLVNREGLMATAAYGATLQLWNYVQMPGMALGGAVSAMAAQAYGAGLPQRIGRINRNAIVLGTAVTALLAALLVLFDKAILGLFLGATSPALPLAEHVVLIGTGGFVLLASMFVNFATMRAFGFVVTPMLVLICSMYGIRLGFYHFAYPALGADAIWWSFPVGSTASMLFAWIAYRVQVGPKIRGD